MKFVSKAVILSLAASLVLFAGGCGTSGLPAGMSPEDVITKALLNQQEITTAIYEISADADLEGVVDGEENALEGMAKLSGTSNVDTGEYGMTLLVDAEMNGESVKANLEIRANKDGVFVKVDGVELSDADTQELVELFLEEYLGEWVKVAFVTAEDLSESGFAEIDYDEGDPLPFKNIEYKGNVDVLGVNSYHFTADVDEKAVMDMAKGSVSEAEEFFEKATIKGDVYVAVDEMVITGFGGTMTLDEEEMNGTVVIQIKVNPTKANAVTTPSYEKEFTEEDLGALMFGGAVMPVDSDFEDMTDEEFEALMLEMEDLDLEEVQ